MGHYDSGTLRQCDTGKLWQCHTKTLTQCDTELGTVTVWHRDTVTVILGRWDSVTLSSAVEWHMPPPSSRQTEIWWTSLKVKMCVGLSFCLCHTQDSEQCYMKISFHWIGPLGQFSHRVAMSVFLSFFSIIIFWLGWNIFLPPPPRCHLVKLGKKKKKWKEIFI